MISFYFFNHQYKDYLKAKKNTNLLNNNDYNNNDYNNNLESFTNTLDKYISTYGFVF